MASRVRLFAGWSLGVVLAATFFSPTRTNAIDPSGFTNIDVGAESDDLHAYMDLYGVDQTTAKQEIGDLASIEELQLTLSEQYSEPFAGLSNSHHPYGLTVAAKDGPRSNTINQIVGSANLRLRPTVVTVAQSYAELRAIADTIVSSAATKPCRLTLTFGRTGWRSRLRTPAWPTS